MARKRKSRVAQLEDQVADQAAEIARLKAALTRAQSGRGGGPGATTRVASRPPAAPK